MVYSVLVLVRVGGSRSALLFDLSSVVSLAHLEQMGRSGSQGPQISKACNASSPSAVSTLGLTYLYVMTFDTPSQVLHLTLSTSSARSSSSTSLVSVLHVSWHSGQAGGGPSGFVDFSKTGFVVLAILPQVSAFSRYLSACGVQCWKHYCLHNRPTCAQNFSPCGSSWH